MCLFRAFIFFSLFSVENRGARIFFVEFLCYLYLFLCGRMSDGVVELQHFSLCFSLSLALARRAFVLLFRLIEKNFAFVSCFV